MLDDDMQALRDAWLELMVCILRPVERVTAWLTRHIERLSRR